MLLKQWHDDGSQPGVSELERATQNREILGAIWGHFKNRDTDRGTKKTVHVRKCPLNVSG